MALASYAEEFKIAAIESPTYEPGPHCFKFFYNFYVIFLVKDLWTINLQNAEYFFLHSLMVELIT